MSALHWTRRFWNGVENLWFVAMTGVFALIGLPMGIQSAWTLLVDDAPVPVSCAALAAGAEAPRWVRVQGGALRLEATLFPEENDSSRRDEVLIPLLPSGAAPGAPVPVLVKTKSPELLALVARVWPAVRELGPTLVGTALHGEPESLPAAKNPAHAELLQSLAEVREDLAQHRELEGLLPGTDWDWKRMPERHDPRFRAARFLDEGDRPDWLGTLLILAAGGISALLCAGSILQTFRRGPR